MKKTILTGIRSNAELHLGNYLGAIKPMVDLQKNLQADDRLFMFVPDLHSFTTPIDHATFYQTSLNNIRMFIAAGLDPANSQTIIFRHSHVPAHSELAIILLNFTYFGEASRMIQFKEKSEQLGNKAVSLGLLTYPVLMAADILLYDTDYVPVCDDQKQHMEMSRGIAERFNNKFGEIFTLPKPWKEQLEFSNRDDSVRIMSLTNPLAKMSKSIEDPRGTIGLLDEPEEARRKIMSAETDSFGKINLDTEKQPGIYNLLQILAILSNQSLKNLSDEWTGKESYGDLKKAVADKVVEFLEGFQSRLSDVSAESVEQILENGEESARQIAEQKLLVVQKAIGLKS